MPKKFWEMWPTSVNYLLSFRNIFTNKKLLNNLNSIMNIHTYRAMVGGLWFVDDVTSFEGKSRPGHGGKNIVDGDVGLVGRKGVCRGIGQTGKVFAKSFDYFRAGSGIQVAHQETGFVELGGYGENGIERQKLVRFG